MTLMTLTGEDTIILNEAVLTDLADGDVGTLDFPNDIMAMSTGKNKNTIFAKDESGCNAELVVRVPRGSSDDKRLNGLFQSQENNFTGFVLLSGAVVKRLGDGAGNITYDTYPLEAGMFRRAVDVASNVNGDTNQGVSIYTIRFALATRALT
jgi:hypothetical protein